MGVLLAMISDSQILDLVVALYAYPGGPVVQWDHFDDGADDDGVYWAAKIIDGVIYIVNRGSVSLEDFERDADALTFTDVQLGPVHRGFMAGMRNQFAEMLRWPEFVQGMPWVATGHSLGAARACLIAGLGAANGVPPLRYVRFGEPRPGCAQLTQLLYSISGISYQTADANGHDDVCDVPVPLPPAFPYEHPTPLVQVPAHPAANDPWGPWKYHHVEYYQSGLAAIGA